MNTPAPDRRQSRRRWLLAWVSIAAVLFTIHSLAWPPPDQLNAGLSRVAEWPGVKSSSNVVDVLLGPFWVALQVLTRDWGVYHPLRGAFACAAGSALGLALMRAGLHCRRVLKTRLLDKRPAGINMARRRVLVEAPLAAGVLIAGGVSAYGGAVAPHQLRVRRYRIGIADLPPGFEGLRAVLIADTHLGPRISAAYIEETIRLALGLKPDLALLGGDYVHSGWRYIAPAAQLFRPLIAAGIPTVGVLGNHDWYNADGLISKHLVEVGVRMVDNSRVYLDGRFRKLVDTPPAEGLCIAGVGDYLCHIVDMDAALAGVPATMPRIVLSHNPDAAELARTQGGSSKNRRVDLMLSGHTHGGQIRLPIIGPPFVPSDHGAKYEGGLVPGPSFPVLVSRGVGMSICPVRLGVPPELVEVTFTRA